MLSAPIEEGILCLVTRSQSSRCHELENLACGYSAVPHRGVARHSHESRLHLRWNETKSMRKVIIYVNNTPLLFSGCFRAEMKSRSYLRPSTFLQTPPFLKTTHSIVVHMTLRHEASCEIRNSQLFISTYWRKSSCLKEWIKRFCKMILRYSIPLWDVQFRLFVVIYRGYCRCSCILPVKWYQPSIEIYSSIIVILSDHHWVDANFVPMVIFQ